LVGLKAYQADNP